MVDWSQGSGWLRLKVILPILCIVTASGFIYLRTRHSPLSWCPGLDRDPDAMRHDKAPQHLHSGTIQT